MSGASPGGVDVGALLAEQGALLVSARGPIPNVAELIAGEPISGSWWAHTDSHAIFAAINELADSPRHRVRTARSRRPSSTGSPV